MKRHLQAPCVAARFTSGLACLLALSESAQAYNSEEHKRLTDRAMNDVVVDSSIVFPANTGFVIRSKATQRQAYMSAKKLAVGIQTNTPSDYRDTTQHTQDNAYSVDDDFRQRQYNLVLYIPDTLDLSDRLLQVEGRTHNDVRTFTLGELVAFYGDYRRTTWCQNGHCYLLNGNFWTLTFNRGDDCKGDWPFEGPCGLKPAPVDMAHYMRCIASGLVPPHGDLGNFVSNTADDFEYTEAGWWGDEMMRIANVNDWHFSSAAAAWYVGMHRLAALYVDSARIHPRYWNNVFHYEANALHSLTDLFALGHMVTHRDETSYQIMNNMELLSDPAYLWQEHVLYQGGATRLAETSEYYAGRVRLSTSLPVVTDRLHYRYDWMPSYSYSWWNFALQERNKHDFFNGAGGTVRNLLGETLEVFGDEKFDVMTAGTRDAISRAVQASVQSLLDGFVALNSNTTLAALTSPGSPLFAALNHVPVFVENDYSDYFDGTWARYADYVDVMAGKDVVPSNWSDCQMAYMGGSDGYPTRYNPACDEFPIAAAVRDEPGVRPETVELSQNVPNPFNPSTVIEFALDAPCDVRLEVFNVLGRKVRTLAEGARPDGRFSVVWNGESDNGASVPSGVYLYRLQTGSQLVTRKLSLIR